MIGDDDRNELDIKADKYDEKSIKDFLSYFQELEKERLICEEVYKKYGRIIKIRRIYARPKGSRNNYYQVTYEKDEKNNDDYGFWY